jgi:Tfp pilus assembly protein PilN
MIEINFLPSEFKHKKQLINIPSGLPLKIFCMVLGALIGVHLIIILIVFGTKVYLHKLNSQVNEKLPRAKEIATMKEEIKKLEEQQQIMSKLFGKRFIWSQKLNYLSDSLPQGLWLTRIIITENIFSLEGTAVSTKAEEMKTINSFLESLKANPEFVSDFSDLALKSIQRRTIKIIEVVDFNLAGLLNQ